mgnify:CR=1 FL=1
MSSDTYYGYVGCDFIAVCDHHDAVSVDCDDNRDDVSDVNNVDNVDDYDFDDDHYVDYRVDDKVDDNVDDDSDFVDDDNEKVNGHDVDNHYVWGNNEDGGVQGTNDV